jgi:hypothetical protein
MPAYTRASTISRIIWSVDSNVRGEPEPGNVLVSVIPTLLVPKNVASVSASDAVKHPCADGYSGWFGVVSNGVHCESAAVSGLPSVSPALIAVTGRQKL